MRNTWLQVTLRASANTRLAAADVFYFGNLVGDAGGNELTVDGMDALATRAGMRDGAAPVGSRVDHNRDGRVDVRDVAAVRQGLGKGLWRLGVGQAVGQSVDQTEAEGLAQAPVPAANAGENSRRRLPYVLY